MTDRIGFEEPRLQRMEQATLWLQRMRTAGQDDRVVEAWLDWCQRDPLNQQAFDEIASIWEISGQLPREAADASVAATANTTTNATATANAASTATATATAAAATAAARGARISRRALAASLAGIGLAGAAAAWWWTQPPDNVLTSEFASPIGTNSVRKLADGSVLELGGGTRVTVSLGSRERRVELHEGEVFVTVHHDTSRPFTVASGSLEVVATGTAFNVLRTTARTTVTVTEGSVAAFQEGRDEETNVKLQSGQQLTYSHASHSVSVRQADPAHAIAWRTGMLYFQGEPLSEVIASINRYTTSSIVIEDPRIRDFPFTGTAYTHAEGIDRWLKAVSGIFAFRAGVKQLADGRRLISPMPDASD